jgi:hypothetical protein
MVIHRLIPLPTQKTKSPMKVAKKAKCKTAAFPLKSQPREVDKKALVRQRKAQLESVGSLVQASIGATARRRYATMWEQFKCSTNLRISARTRAPAVDAALCQVLHEMFLEGQSLSAAQYMVASVLFHAPQFKSHRMSLLPTSKQTMQGWRKLDPPLSRLPLPPEVVCLMAKHAFRTGRIQEGLMMHLAMEAYLRPGEITRIRVMDFVPPLPGSRGAKWSIVLHPVEMQRMSKAQEFDETILMDLPDQGILAETIYRVCRLGFRQNYERVFSPSFQQMMDVMQAACHHYNLQSLGPPHAYRLRHAGPSRDFLLKLRTMSDIQHRGRWKASSSTRRYQKGGRLQQMMHLLPDAARREALRAYQDRAQTLRGLR